MITLPDKAVISLLYLTSTSADAGLHKCAENAAKFAQSVYFSLLKCFTFNERSGSFQAQDIVRFWNRRGRDVELWLHRNKLGE